MSCKCGKPGTDPSTDRSLVQYGVRVEHQTSPLPRVFSVYAMLCTKLVSEEMIAHRSIWNFLGKKSSQSVLRTFEAPGVSFSKWVYVRDRIVPDTSEDGAECSQCGV